MSWCRVKIMEVGEDSEEDHFESLKHIEFVRRLKNYLCIFTGYPYFSRAFVREHIDRPNTDRDELLEYEKTSRRHFGGLASIMIISSLVFCIKSTALPLKMFSTFDFKTTGANLIPIDDSFYRFDCLVSNCSRLTPSLLEEPVSMANYEASSSGDRDGDGDRDGSSSASFHPPLAQLNTEALNQLGQLLLSLPHYSLCHPKLSILHDPVQDIGMVGIIAMTGTAYTVLLSGICLPLVLIFNKTNNLVLMFLVAPKVTRRLVFDQARQILEQMAHSLENYWRNHRDMLDQRSEPAAGHWKLRDRDRARNYNSPRFHNMGLSRYPKDALEGSQTSLCLSALEGTSVGPVANDCISVVRSRWWHQNTASSLFCLFWIYLVTLSVVSLMAPTSISIYLGYREDQVRELGRYMKRTGCNMWVERTDATGGSAGGERLLEPLELDKYPLRLNWVRSILYTLQAVCPFLVISYFLVLYVLTITELTCWLSEIRFQLVLCVEFLKQLLLYEARPERAVVSGSCRHFSMEILRKNFKLLTSINIFLMAADMMADLDESRQGHVRTSGALQFKSKLTIERLVAQTIEREQLCEASASELLEKMYVCFKLFVQGVQQSGPTMTVMLFIINLYIYGYVVISMWFLRAVDQFIAIPAILLISSFSGANILIALASNFHAKANKMHSLIWDLIATTCHCKDLRVQHMRALWLKRIDALDMDGGLALEAFKFRITYLRIIQLIITIGTLVAFILHI